MGCGPLISDESGTDSDGETEGGTEGTSDSTTVSTSTTTTTTTAGPTTQPPTSTTEPPTTIGPTTLPPTSSSTSVGMTDGDTESTGPQGCSREPAELNFVWIANAAEGTVSKVNTETLVEEARYVTRPDGMGSPSRTSVNFNGDVAVANRSGGITVIAGNPERCPDPMATSTGPGDVRVWPDGCVIWHSPFTYASQRPIAWTSGAWDTEACEFVDTQVWTSGTDGSSSIDVLLLDGESGDVAMETQLPPEVIPSFYGIYGGAVDSEGNFWGSQLGSGHLVNVDRDMGQARVWPMPASGYGMTIDHQGRIWTCSGTVARFDPLTEVWDTNTVQGQAGCMEDGQGTLWVGSDPMVGVDIDTLQITQTVELPQYVHGISIDFNGRVWGVGLDSSAFRYDPSNGNIDTVTGFVGAYTYSDMTGFALANVSR